ncbi:hypothetical protein CB0940_10686 [Cercospora beticola]|uniref:F-box domain-containing protein n=1 Tax=Cercospora beticola TaxID=122368 RepID=A0A2G5HUB4_CERBT|nr:hypothetical protein CB0940_10686 [Cercospora beticola]PIA96128.1 hypothetical protein CB0940_10686 [Cercospora beticola]WPB07413.1 hypothetical protein RHO25_012074 [Cercospora beticola]
MYELCGRVVTTTTNKPKPRQFKPKGFLAKTTVLSYKRRYSRKALQTLVKSRGGLYPEKEKVKAVYARILVDLDENGPKFSEAVQFLELPPELRNRVYAELLTLPDGLVDHKAGAFPAILSTNKQVYSEAVGILYGENTGLVKFDSSSATEDPTELYRSLRTVRYNINHYGEKSKVEDMQPNWSGMLGRFSRLKITIQLPHSYMGSWGPPTYASRYTSDSERITFAVMANQSLFTLVSYLSSNPDLRSVEFECEYLPRRVGEFSQATLQHMIWPITLLPQLKKLSLGGFPLRIGFDVELNSVSALSEEPILATLRERLEKVNQLSGKMWSTGHPHQHEFIQAINRATTVLDRNDFVDEQAYAQLVSSSEELAEILKEHMPAEA